MYMTPKISDHLVTLNRFCKEAKAVGTKLAPRFLENCAICNDVLRYFSSKKCFQMDTTFVFGAFWMIVIWHRTGSKNVEKQCPFQL